MKHNLLCFFFLNTTEITGSAFFSSKVHIAHFKILQRFKSESQTWYTHAAALKRPNTKSEAWKPARLVLETHYGGTCQHSGQMTFKKGVDSCGFFVCLFFFEEMKVLFFLITDWTKKCSYQYSLCDICSTVPTGRNVQAVQQYTWQINAVQLTLCFICRNGPAGFWVEEVRIRGFYSAFSPPLLPGDRRLSPLPFSNVPAMMGSPDFVAFV